MRDMILIEIVTPEGPQLSDEVDQVTAPGVGGELGVLPGHRPLLCGLKPGPLQVGKGGHTSWYCVGGGFMEVDWDLTVVLANSCEAASEIDAERARRARDRALETMARVGKTDDPEYRAAGEALARAEARLAVAGKA